MSVYVRDPATLTISDVSAASPEMDAAQFREFVASIREHGQQVPVLVSGDGVYDGRKRVRACQEIGVAVAVVDISPNQDPTALAHALNIWRTHYTTSQRAMFAARMATRPHGVSRIPKSGSRGVTIPEAAARTGVSTGMVSLARYVQARAAPDVVAAVDAGELSLHAASNESGRPPQSRPSGAKRKTGGRPRDTKKYAAALPMLEEAASHLRWAGEETPVGKYKRSLLKTADRIKSIVRMMRAERGEQEHGEEEAEAL